jgi:phosphoglycerate dehydrogenase-like enzyme
VIREADFVVGVLPRVPGVTDGFFNNESTFSKMKESAVFINIGRGSTVKEDDLIEALKHQKIAGAVLDVFEIEPLPRDSELWKLPNVLMTPHCADNDAEFMQRSIQIFGENLELFMEGGAQSLKNICDKQRGY